MTATALKKELYKALDNIEDQKFLQAVYTELRRNIFSK